MSFLDPNRILVVQLSQNLDGRAALASLSCYYYTCPQPFQVMMLVSWNPLQNGCAQPSPSSSFHGQPLKETLWKHIMETVGGLKR